jgi:hypothetical protein
VTPPNDSKDTKLKSRRKLQKAYTIDVQGWQKKSNSKVTSLENFSA